MRAPDLRHQFWQEFKLYMADASIGCSRPSNDGWMWHAADLSSGYLASLVNVRLGQIGVRFRLNGPNADTVFSFLESRRPQVDTALETPPTWRRGEGSSHVIEILHSADISARAAWPEHMTWLRSQLEGFQSALWPFVGRVPPAGGRRPWDERRFFDKLAKWNPSGTGPAATILESARQQGDAIHWGSGGQIGSFAPSVPRQGVAHQLVSVKTDGTFQLLFTRLGESPPFSDRAHRAEVLRRVNQVRYLLLPEASIGRRPSVPLAVLGEPEVCLQLCEVLGWFRDIVKGG